MLPNMLFPSCRVADSSRKKKTSRVNADAEHELRYSMPFKLEPVTKQPTKSSLRSHVPHPNTRNGSIRKMAHKVSNFSDLIQRVTASCLLHPLTTGRHESDDISEIHDDDNESEEDVVDSEYAPRNLTDDAYYNNTEGEVEEERAGGITVEMEMLMGEVFEAVLGMKRAYVSMQEAHCPWDPDKMREADVAVVAELRRLGVLRERFRRSGRGVGMGRGRGRRVVGEATLREVVAPYEAAVEEMKKEVKKKEREVENLREKLKTATGLGGSGGKKGSSGRSHQSKRKVSCIGQGNNNVRRIRLPLGQPWVDLELPRSNPGVVKIMLGQRQPRTASGD